MDGDAHSGVANSQRPQHSVKVPRLYKEAAKALKQVEENGEGLKNAIHSLKHPVINPHVLLYFFHWVTPSILFTSFLCFGCYLRTLRQSLLSFLKP